MVWVGPCSMQARADLAAGHRGEALPEDCTPCPGTRWRCAASGITLRRGRWRSLPQALPGSSPSLQPPGSAHAFTSYKADVLPFFKMYLLFIETLFCKYSNLVLYVNLFHIAHLEAFPDPHTESAQFTVTAPGTARRPPSCQPMSDLLPVRQLRHADPLGMSRPCRLSPRAASLPAVPSDVITGQLAAVSRSQAAATQVEGGELGLLKPAGPRSPSGFQGSQRGLWVSEQPAGILLLCCEAVAGGYFGRQHHQPSTSNWPWAHMQGASTK